MLVLIIAMLTGCRGGGETVGSGSSGDTTPPSTPTGLSAVAASANQINLSWTESTDDVGVAGYKTYKDGVFLKEVSTTSTSDTGLSPSTTYCYTVSAYDGAGNKSAESSSVCVATPMNTWAKAYGGGDDDYAYSMVQTSDGGYALAGYTYSFDTGNGDFWVLKLDASGNVTWEKTYGGGSYDYAHSMVQTSDGGYAVAGYTYSFGAGGADLWVLKLDASGNVLWEKTYGWGWNDVAYSIIQTSDSGYAVAGYTYLSASWAEFWVLKLDTSGNVSWQKTYGGDSDEFAQSIVQTSDGGYAVAGGTNSFGAGGADLWVLKLDTSGNVSWQKTYGGDSDEFAQSIVQTSDGGYAVAGGTDYFGAGNNDFWVLKLDTSGNIGASCGIIGASTTSATDTSVTGSGSFGRFYDTAVYVITSAAIIADTSVLPAVQCTGP